MKAKLKATTAILTTALILSGCSPAKMATTPPKTDGTAVAGSGAGAGAETGLGKAGLGNESSPSSLASPPSLSQSAQPAQTPAGQRIAELQKDSRRLKTQFSAHETDYRRIRAVMVDSSQRYFNATGDIRAQLEVGSTPGNPLLQQQWERARAELDRVAAVMTELNQLNAKVGDDGALVAYLLESIQATYRLGGAMDKDHEALLALGDEVSRDAVLVERLASQVTAALARQTAHLSNERNNISTLQSAVKIGELYSTNLMSLGLGRDASPAATSTPTVTAPSTSQPNASPASFTPSPNPAAASQATVTNSKIDVESARQLLYTVNFDRTSPAFQQQLYTAVNEALTKNPSAQFDLVTVISGAAAGGNAANLAKAQRNAQTVLRALTDMGMPLNRIRTDQVTEASTQFNQVKIFAR